MLFTDEGSTEEGTDLFGGSGENILDFSYVKFEVLARAKWRFSSVGAVLVLELRRYI